MSEMIVTFQTQLSGVMETVFKAAIFEITRLVEVSFLDEVSRSREQVESLKKKLQWSESREKGRCDCSSAKTPKTHVQKRDSPTQTGEEMTQYLKEERVQKSWGNCRAEEKISCTVMAETDDASTTANVAEQQTVQEEGKLECTLKAEAVQTAIGTERQDEWKLSTEVPESSVSSAHDKTYSEQVLQQIQDEWSSGLDNATKADPEPDMNNIQGLLYRNRYNLEDLGSYGNHELNMEEMDGLAEANRRAGEVLGFGGMAGTSRSDASTSEECRRRARNKRDKKVLPHLHDNPGTAAIDCMIINEEGFLQDVNSLPQAASVHAADSQVHPMYNKDNSFYSSDAFIQSLDLNNRCAEIMVDAEQGALSCTQCMITFSDQASLKAHMNAHRQRIPTTPYTCNQCGKKFPQACNLKVHQRVHQREGLHMCSHCAKGFSSFADLRRHRCSQGGEKPYSCSLCGNNFRRLWNLKLHRRIHTQEKPHRCNMCDKSFTRADILKIHQRTHTGERPYSCKICGLTFKRLDHLRSHQRKHTV
ncbi:zinc finger protein 25 [Trichomycterus rosablanca]|uniref:zinc finger protein 25 n=1 Tax=Trichomycterus rosablanca TaxID=2290929 RepID=UPI002F35A301